MQREEGVVVRGRVVIDTRQPFSSVREAVMLFGEKVLAGEVYGNKLKEMQSNANYDIEKQQVKIGDVKAELEETKKSLEKSKEEGYLMAHCLNSVRQELEQTKRELHQLKNKETLSHHLDKPEIEDLKFVENTIRVDQIMTINSPDKTEPEFQKKRSVKFASPLMTKVMDIDQEAGELGTTKTKTKKKPLVPLLGGLFFKKKKTVNKDGES